MPDDKREPVDWSGLTVGETVVIPRDLPWEAIGLRPPEGEPVPAVKMRCSVTGPSAFTYTFGPEQPRPGQPWRRRGKRGKP